MDNLIEHIFDESKDDSIEFFSYYTEMFVTIQQLSTGMSIPVAVFKDHRAAQSYENFQRKLNPHRHLLTFAVDVDNRLLKEE